MRKDKLLPRGLEMEFEGGLEEEVTAHAGVSLLVETGRRSGVMEKADQVLPGKKNPKGLGQGQMVESFVLLSALGGECLEDFEQLRADLGLEAMVGYPFPAPSTARSWLDRFHDETAMAQRPVQGSFIPRESAGLEGLRELERCVLRAYVSVARPDRDLTMDVDAHLVASAKREALVTYEGFRGYQPLIVTWAETELVLADQFRDGNVLAGKGIAELVDEAYESLPAHPDGWVVAVRSDSAAYDQRVLNHWHERGWRFAVSADMSKQLRAEIDKLSPEQWHPWAVEEGGFVREWAEVPFVPGRAGEKKDAKPYRYLAIRIRSCQGLLFSDGNGVKSFAVVTNDWDTEGRALLEWQRGKAGTVEHTHHILKDELAAGVYPSGKFGADAAWLRIQVLTANLLVLMKAVALDKEYRKARPKRLRFAIFNHVGRVVHHARESFIRLHRLLMERITKPGLLRLRVAAWPSG
ncbi:MAG TPA: IS1380 family transposase [Chloroflexota bacterium]|nr:IS1380 family transposase [Chloroflexota bacterium]